MVRESGDKVIFMENGEPELVVMSFAEYEKLARAGLQGYGNVHGQEAEVRSDVKIPRDPIEDMVHETEFMAPHGAEHAPISASYQEVTQRPQRTDAPRLQDIRLEDLPI